jgi:hypothetical protein
MGAAARRRYEQLFTPEAVVPVLLDFYEQVIHRHSTNGQAGTNGHRRLTELSHPWMNS